ncbi:MAG: hypothetical protein BWY83_01727 [bacterium ADurb.Bin478]|nr:MAG: hypothetical protein BWY83_01727 [bacterium ADurb.Bin478]
MLKEDLQLLNVVEKGGDDLAEFQQVVKVLFVKAAVLFLINQYDGTDNGTAAADGNA